MPPKLPPDQHRVTVSFRVPPELQQWVLLASAELGTSKSAFVVACLEMARTRFANGWRPPTLAG